MKVPIRREPIYKFSPKEGFCHYMFFCFIFLNYIFRNEKPEFTQSKNLPQKFTFDDKERFQLECIYQDFQDDLHTWCEVGDWKEKLIELDYTAENYQEIPGVNFSEIDVIKVICSLHKDTTPSFCRSLSDMLEDNEHYLWDFFEKGRKIFLARLEHRCIYEDIKWAFFFDKLCHPYFHYDEINSDPHSIKPIWDLECSNCEYNSDDPIWKSR